jgi:NADH-quinone oxidoreductase subunit N
LAGIPVTAGFIGKFYAIAGGVSARLWPLVILLVLNSVIGVYYYLRLIVTMFDRGALPEGEIGKHTHVMNHISWAARAPLGIVLLLLLLFGLYPQPFINMLGVLLRPEAGLPSASGVVGSGITIADD